MLKASQYSISERTLATGVSLSLMPPNPFTVLLDIEISIQWREEGAQNVVGSMLPNFRFQAPETTLRTVYSIQKDAHGSHLSIRCLRT